MTHNIINCLNKITIPSLTIRNIIHEAIHFINSFDTCVITHNFREANCTADWAANVACFNDHNIIWGHYDSLPPNRCQFFDHDKLRSM